MAKTKISEFDSTPANNTDIDSINIAEGCAPSGINNAIRELMSQLKDQQTGASADNFTVGGNLAVTGTSAFTGATTFTAAVVMSTALPVASGGTGAATHTSKGVLIGNGTSAVTTVSPGTSGNVLTSDGTSWASVAVTTPTIFDAGTRIMFVQTSAPTGWTKDTTNYNNHAIRVVTGTASTGGSVDFTTAFTSGLSAGATTLTTAQIPSHTHSIGVGEGTGASGPYLRPSQIDYSASSGAEGGGGSHTHTIPSFAVKYLDVITATKN